MSDPSPTDPRLDDVERKIDNARSDAEETDPIDASDADAEPRFSDPGQLGGPVDDAIAPG
ncbi:MAG: hypothetical protein QOF60_2811 [Actinomycetota bacterium]|jgi:hypothetical protein|nr:hypothetical protein [Actinomycetota bacterium]